jgi:hypothetical protein
MTFGVVKVVPFGRVQIKYCPIFYIPTPVSIRFSALDIHKMLLSDYEVHRPHDEEKLLVRDTKRMV